MRYMPVAYSAATRRAMASMVQQLKLTNDYLGYLKNGNSTVAERIHQVDVMQGITLSLKFIAEAHRQWTDHTKWDTEHSGYYKLTKSLEEGL